MSNNQEPNQDDPLLLDHDYDGIRELDNKLPRWWVWLFNLCTVFAVFYMLYYHRPGRGSAMAAEYAQEMLIGDAIKSRSMAEFETKVDSMEPSKDPLVLGRGQATFVSKCAPCHRADAGGLVGPNLCDDYWIHGPKFADNMRTIWNGVEAKGMLAWKKQGMKPAEVVEVASYIYTLRGTNPKNPKPPENQTPVKTGPSEFE